MSSFNGLFVTVIKPKGIYRETTLLFHIRQKKKSRIKVAYVSGTFIKWR